MDSALERAPSVGTDVPKGDARLKASGAAFYAGDLRPPRRGLLCGKILRSPHPHASIISIDTSKAAGLKGVYAVVTGADAAPVRIGRFLKDRTILARDKVRFIGEPVAAVAAVDEATANEALSLIRVEYALLPALFAPDQAMAPDAPIIHEDLSDYEEQGPTRRCGNQRNYAQVERGDVEAAFSKAHVVVEGRFTTQPVHQGFLEPKTCVASGDNTGKLTLWASNRSPFLCRTLTSRALGLPLSKVRVIAPMIGGSFGGKAAPTIEPVCALLAIKATRPVKLALGTDEELGSGFVRHPAVINLRVAASSEGRLLGLDGEVSYNCGAYCDARLGMAPTCSYLQGSYNWSAVRLKGRSVFTNLVPAGQVRAPGAPQTLFAIESIIDELARQLNLDPFEIRRLNALKDGDLAPGKNATMGNAGLRETIDKVAEYVKQHVSVRERNQGLGVACGAWNVRPPEGANPSKCIVKLNEDGGAVLLTGLPDNGAGQHVVLSQIVGDVLGIEPHQVTVVGGDTDLTPFDNGPGGSRATIRAGNAAKFAAEDARRQIFDLAASKLEADPRDLELGNRTVHVKGAPDRAVGLAVLAGAALTSPGGAIIGTGRKEREEWVAKAGEYANVADEASFCTHAVQVEVDPETGQVTVLKYAAAQDVGRVLNRLNVLGQIHGGVVAGLGYALGEELVIRDGRVANTAYADYRMPLADTAAAVHVILVEHPSLLGPFGAKGIGELPITPVAAAVANAIYDAVGIRIRELPITPEKILRALKGKGSPES